MYTCGVVACTALRVVKRQPRGCDGAALHRMPPRMRKAEAWDENSSASPVQSASSYAFDDPARPDPAATRTRSKSAEGRAGAGQHSPSEGTPPPHPSRRLDPQPEHVREDTRAIDHDTGSQPEPEPEPVKRRSRGKAKNKTDPDTLSHEDEDYWVTVGQLHYNGRLGWEIIDSALEPEFKAEEEVPLEGTKESFPLLGQVEECLRKLASFEQLCKQVSSNAERDADRDTLMADAKARDDLAADILTDLKGPEDHLPHGRSPLLPALHKQREKLQQRKAKIVEQWGDTFRDRDERFAQDERFATNIDIRAKDMEAPSCTKGEAEDKCREFKRNFVRRTRDSQSVLGEEIQKRITALTDKQEEITEYTKRIARGEEVDPTAASNTVKKCKREFRKVGRELVEASTKAEELCETARDFMASQYLRVTGTPWQEIGAVDPDDGRVPREVTMQWRLDTRLAAKCLQVVKAT